MNVEQFRDYCLSLAGVSERMTFASSPDPYNRDILCFYVGDKWFCLVNIEAFDFCSLKCDPDESSELQARYMGITPGWHMNKRHWISVRFDSDVPDDEIKRLVRNSYESVRATLPARLRRVL